MTASESATADSAATIRCAIGRTSSATTARNARTSAGSKPVRAPC